MNRLLLFESRASEYNSIASTTLKQATFRKVLLCFGFGMRGDKDEDYGAYPYFKVLCRNLSRGQHIQILKLRKEP